MKAISFSCAWTRRQLREIFEFSFLFALQASRFFSSLGIFTSLTTPPQHYRMWLLHTSTTAPSYDLIPLSLLNSFHMHLLLPNISKQLKLHSNEILRFNHSKKISSSEYSSNVTFYQSALYRFFRSPQFDNFNTCLSINH